MSDDERSSEGPPKLQRARGPGVPPGAAPTSRAEVTAAAAIAAGLPYRGQLAKDSPLRLLYLAAAAGATGTLRLASDAGRFALHFKRGVIEQAASDAPHDALGPFLLARGAVTAAALAEAERRRGAFGGDLLAALASLRQLEPTDSFRFLREHGTGLIARAVGSDRGECGWEPDAPLTGPSFPLGSRWGILCEAVRQLDGATVRTLLGDRSDRAPTRSGGRIELAQLKLTAHEARAVSLLDGRASAAQLAATWPAEAETIFRMTLLLAETELLVFGALLASPRPSLQPGPARDEPRPPAPAPTPRAPTPRPAVPGEAKVPAPPTVQRAVPAAPAPRTQVAPQPAPGPTDDAASLQAYHARICGADHFEALGVKRDSGTAHIKLAYFQLAKRYHPDAGPPGEPPDLKKLRADIFARLGEAWGVLGNDAARASYLAQLAAGGAAEVDVSAILKAEETFRKGTMLVRGRQYEKALSTLEEAMALNPDEPEFGVWAAWARFLLSRQRAQQHGESSAAIEGALKKVPRCIAGYLFLAQMAKIMGDLAAAERHLKRGLGVDPQNVDLARELKYLRK